MSLHIDKTPVPVMVHLADGSVRNGTFFLGAQSGFRVGPETVFDLLSDRESWIPFSDQERGFSVVRKSLIAFVRHRSTDPNAVVSSGELAVKFVFANRATLRGVVRRDDAGTGARLVDYMNRVTGFVELVDGEEHYAVNTALIIEASPD